MAATKLATFQSLPFQLSLRIKHPSMDPANISKELGIEPEHSFRAGQSRRFENRRCAGCGSHRILLAGPVKSLVVVRHFAIRATAQRADFTEHDRRRYRRGILPGRSACAPCGLAKRTPNCCTKFARRAARSACW